MNSKWSKHWSLKIMLFLSLSLRITFCERNKNAKSKKITCQNAHLQINLNPYPNPGAKKIHAFFSVSYLISLLFFHFEHHCHFANYPQSAPAKMLPSVQNSSPRAQAHNFHRNVNMGEKVKEIQEAKQCPIL